MRVVLFGLGAIAIVGTMAPVHAQTVLCTTVKDMVICDNGASATTVGDVTIYTPPTTRDPVPVQRPPAVPWIR